MDSFWYSFIYHEINCQCNWFKITTLRNICNRIKCKILCFISILNIDLYDWEIVDFSSEEHRKFKLWLFTITLGSMVFNSQWFWFISKILAKNQFEIKELHLFILMSSGVPWDSSKSHRRTQCHIYENGCDLGMAQNSNRLVFIEFQLKILHFKHNLKITCIFQNVTLALLLAFWAISRYILYVTYSFGYLFVGVLISAKNAIFKVSFRY